MGRYFRNSYLRRSVLYHVPDYLLGNAVTPDGTHAAAAKQPPVRDRRRSYPRLDGGLYPVRNRHSSDVRGFADQVNDDPVFLPLVEVSQAESCYFAPAQSTAKQQRQNGLVAPALQPLEIRSLE
jgi:hypothetical protein